MLVLTRDGAWLARLERIAVRGGWPFEARAAMPAPGRAAPVERAVAVLDRGLAGAVPSKAVGVLRGLYPGAAVVLACDPSDIHDAHAAIGSGADEVLAKTLGDDRLAARLSALRDHALKTRSRASADGGLVAELRAHRARVRGKTGKWKEVALDAGGFALLWRLLEREGEAVTREGLGEALSAADGKERSPETVARRLAALRKALASWGGEIESARGGAYRLVSKPRERANLCGGRRRRPSRPCLSRPS